MKKLLLYVGNNSTDSMLRKQAHLTLEQRALSISTRVGFKVTARRLSEVYAKLKIRKKVIVQTYKKTISQAERDEKDFY